MYIKWEVLVWYGWYIYKYDTWWSWRPNYLEKFQHSLVVYIASKSSLSFHNFCDSGDTNLAHLPKQVNQKWYTWHTLTWHTQASALKNHDLAQKASKHLNFRCASYRGKLCNRIRYYYRESLKQNSKRNSKKTDTVKNLKTLHYSSILKTKLLYFPITKKPATNRLDWHYD